MLNPLERVFKKAVKTPMPALVARFEKLGAEHGRSGKRDQHRDGYGDTERDGEFAEEFSDDAAHEKWQSEEEVEGHRGRLRRGQAVDRAVGVREAALDRDEVIDVQAEVGAEELLERPAGGRGASVAVSSGRSAH